MLNLINIYETQIVKLIKEEYLVANEIFIPWAQMREIERQYGFKNEGRVKGQITQFHLDGVEVRVTLNESLKDNEFQLALDAGNGGDRIFREYEIRMQVEQRVIQPGEGFAKS